MSMLKIKFNRRKRNGWQEIETDNGEKCDAIHIHDSKGEQIAIIHKDINSKHIMINASGCQIRVI